MKTRSPGPGAWLLALVLGVCACSKPEPVAQAPNPRLGPSVSSPLAKDPRLSFLLAKQTRDEHYSVDTSNLLAILETTLRHGQRDPLIRARQELGAQGAVGLELAERMIQEAWSDPDKAGLMRNALDVVGYSREERAAEVAAHALQHPAPELALTALRMLKGKSSPRWFDAVRAMFDRMPGDLAGEVALSLFRFDPDRATEQYASWIKSGSISEPPKEILQLLAAGKDPASALLCAELYPSAPVPANLYYAARAARGGDAKAQDVLRSYLNGDNEMLQGLACEAAGAAGLCELVQWCLRSENTPALRKLALRNMSVDCLQASRDLMRSASSANDDELASQALSVLVELYGDKDAVDRALLLLVSDAPGALQKALKVLDNTLRREPKLAERALALLIERDQKDLQRPFWERAPILSAISTLPAPGTADYLAKQWHTKGPDLDGLGIYYWLSMRIGSTGTSGQELLWRALEKEQDPKVRIDLMEAFSALGGPHVRQRLLEFMLSESAAPLEILYAADRLVRIGPAEKVVPVLKRSTLRVQDPGVRLALQGLLWLNYPGPSGAN